MKINSEEKNGVLVFRVFGDVDINTSPEVKKIFDKKLTDKNNKVVINLKDAGYLDSSGLATLIEIFKKVRAFGGTLKLTNLSTKVMGLFEITKLDKLFDIRDEEDDAVNSYMET